MSCCCSSGARSEDNTEERNSKSSSSISSLNVSKAALAESSSFIFGNAVNKTSIGILNSFDMTEGSSGSPYFSCAASITSCSCKKASISDGLNLGRRSWRSVRTPNLTGSSRNSKKIPGLVMKSVRSISSSSSLSTIAGRLFTSIFFRTSSASPKYVTAVFETSSSTARSASVKLAFLKASKRVNSSDIVKGATRAWSPVTWSELRPAMSVMSHESTEVKKNLLNERAQETKLH